jgi:hypothetical protein
MGRLYLPQSLLQGIFLGSSFFLSTAATSRCSKYSSSAVNASKSLVMAIPNHDRGDSHDIPGS